MWIEKDPLYAVDHTRPGEPAEDRLEVKRGLKDRCQDRGYLPDIQDDDEKPEDDIDRCHNGHHDRGHPADLVRAAEEEHEAHHEQERADDERDAVAIMSA